MIMLTVTKPRRKLKRVLQGLALALLLAVVVPGIYHSMEAAGAMSMFASGKAAAPETQTKQTELPEQAALTETEAQPQAEPSTEAKPTAETEQAEQPEPTAKAEPTAEIEPTAETPAAKPGLWQSLLNIIFGEKPQVTPY